MHYSKLLLALPLAHAAVIARDEAVYDVYTTVVDVVTTTIGAAAAPATPAVQAADANQGQQQPQQQPQQQQQPGQHGHGKFHQNPNQGANQYQPPSSTSAAAPPPASSSAAAQSNSNSGNSNTGGCPADTSGKNMSPGVNGQPDKSMLDSTNYIRRLYNPSATCLQWSDSLAQASQNCANIASESDLRMNSDVVSDPNYGGNYFTGDLASTQFERSMFVMLCQSPSDPQLKGQCPGKVGEVGCTAGACTGHHDAIVDAKGENKYVGAAANAGTKWMSCSFSSDSSA